MKKPKLYQHICHHVDSKCSFDGVVTELLSDQFVYLTKYGSYGMVLYKGDWKVMKSEKTNVVDDIKEPSVWKNKDSILCIVVKTTKKSVRFIPLSIDNPSNVEEIDKEDFINTLGYTITDFPIGRAARLYIGYARHIGATNEVLNALSKFTSTTNEARKMIMQETSTATSSGASAPKPRKATKKKVAAAKSKTTTTKKKVATKKKESMAAIYRKAIESGKTAKQIIAMVNRKYPDKGTMVFVKFYWKKMCEAGANIPEPKGLVVGKRGRKPKNA